MKFNYLLLVLIIFGCSAPKKALSDEIDIGKCKEIYPNNFSSIKIENLSTITDHDTIIVHELRFECVQAIIYTSKVMFDKYGKWDAVIRSTDNMHPVLMWKEVDLFNNGKKYQILTKGRFTDLRYASVMIFDLNGNDLLADYSPEKEKLIAFFSDLIKTNKSEKREFYIHYWNTVNPDKWKL